MSTVEVVVKCDLCGGRVKGDNSDSWAAKLPLKTLPPTEEELKENPDLERPEYSICIVDVCFPCKDALGDWIKARIGK